MKIVIDISEEARNKLFDIANNGKYIPFSLQNTMIMAIANGTPLPKNHGRLIDADELNECKELMTTITDDCKYAVRMDDIRNAPTIIEAESEEDNED